MSDVVRLEIEERNLDSYRRAARFLNAAKADVVSVQHEFGIFGGPAGSHLLALLRDWYAGGHHASHGPAQSERRPT